MPGNEFDREAIAPAAPPTQAGELGTAARPSNWPTVIGVIAIVFGAGGLLIGLWGAVAPFFTGSMVAGPFTGQTPGMKAMQESTVWTVPVSLLSAGVAIILLAAGIGLLSRRAWSVRLARIWAVAKIAIVVLDLVAKYTTMQSTFDVAQGPGMAPVSSDFLSVFAGIWVCFGLLWGWALPVFMLIWFSRSKIKAEVTQWA